MKKTNAKDELDLRVIKTKRAIRNGFADCISRTAFSKITIKNLTEAALINKSTFYKYYTDKYDLRKSLVIDTLEEFEQSIDTGFLRDDYSDFSKYEEMVLPSLISIYQQREWYQCLWNPNMQLNVYSMMQSTFENVLRSALRTKYALDNDQSLTAKQEYFARLFASNALCTIKWWLEYTPTSTEKEIARLITNNIAKGNMISLV